VIPTLEPGMIPTLEPVVIPAWNWGHTQPMCGDTLGLCGGTHEGWVRRIVENGKWMVESRGSGERGTGNGERGTGDSGWWKVDDDRRDSASVIHSYRQTGVWGTRSVSPYDRGIHCRTAFTRSPWERPPGRFLPWNRR
jgi:hypothetical protein